MLSATSRFVALFSTEIKRSITVLAARREAAPPSMPPHSDIVMTDTAIAAIATVTADGPG